MNNPMLKEIEDLLKKTDEVKSVLQEKGYNVSIDIKTSFENCSNYSRVVVSIVY